MKDFNHVAVNCRLTGDAKLDYLNSGSAKMNFSVAFTTSKQVDGKWVDETGYLNLTMWGSKAEKINPYMKKGTFITVSGHLKQDRWEKDGQKQSALKVIVDDVQLLSRPQGNNGGNASEEPVEESSNEGGFKEDIPF